MGLLAVGFACAVAGCKTNPSKPVSPFRIDESVFRERIQTLCLEPISNPFSLPEGDKRIEKLTGLLIGELEARGFSVVRSDRLAELRKRELESAGGIYDPHTGRIVPARYEAFMARYLESAGAKLGCDAILHASVAVVTASFYSNWAEWDGAREKIGSSGYSGTVPAISLWVEITDLEQQELYFRSGGIQILKKLDTGFLKAELEPIPQEQILARKDRCLEAVRLALAMLGTPTLDAGTASDSRP